MKEMLDNFRLRFSLLQVLYQEAVSKSEELMIGDFKQYFDEEFTEKMAELIYGGNNGKI